jgi:sulfane dehydrogenase subunit SoxC
MLRRVFVALLVTGGAGAVLSACAPQAQAVVPVSPLPRPAPAPGSVGPSIVKPVPDNEFIRHGTSNAETRFELLGEAGYKTPNRLFYVRNHGPTPIIDERTWSLSISGSGIDRPFSLTCEQLLALPSRTVTCSLECAGNGRVFYEELLKKKAEGDPWRLGAFGIAEWTGVSLADVLRSAGLKKSAVDVMPVGLDSARVERPMPVEKAMEGDTLIAYRMNGEPLPPDHGFPARVIVPGWVGVASVKWVGEIIVSETPTHVKWNTEEYVFIGPDYAPVPPAKGPALTTQVIKSGVFLKWPGTLREGPQTIAGHAWSPFGKIAKVDVSLDGGKTNRRASLVGPNLERAGTRWELSFEAHAGDLTITSRATDESGHTQPDLAQQKWNEKGYNFGAALAHPVRVTR